MTETEPTRILRLQASLSLSAALLEAVDESSILRAVMRTGCEVLGANGCFFMPFDEFSQRFSPLGYGPVHAFDVEGILQPAQRQRCKVCETRQAGRECALLHGNTDANSIHCIPLRMRGREAGLFSFISAEAMCVDDPAASFLSEIMHLAEIALDKLERGQLVYSLQYSNAPSGLTEKALSVLPQIEYRAIVGERTRLAREIHDGLAQSLAFLKIEIGRAESLLARGISAQAACILKDASRTINDIYLDARQAIENLRSVPDDHLETWLQQVVENFEELSGLPVEMDLRLENDFSPSVQVQLIRIVQEALTNIRKHAQSDRVRVSAWEDGQHTMIEVMDKGRGFDPSDAAVPARFGLRGMRERAESIGAELQVTSSPNDGTTVRIQIPLHPLVTS